MDLKKKMQKAMANRKYEAMKESLFNQALHDEDLEEFEVTVKSTKTGEVAGTFTSRHIIVAAATDKGIEAAILGHRDIVPRLVLAVSGSVADKEFLNDARKIGNDNPLSDLLDALGSIKVGMGPDGELQCNCPDCTAQRAEEANEEKLKTE